MIYTSDKDKINTTALDCWSWGHILFGEITTIVSFLVILFLNILIPLEIGFITFIATSLIGIFWEFLENGILKKYGVFDTIEDRWNNCICDILCVMLGCGLILIPAYVRGGDLSWLVGDWITVVYLTSMMFILEYWRMKI